MLLLRVRNIYDPLHNGLPIISLPSQIIQKVLYAWVWQEQQLSSFNPNTSLYKVLQCKTENKKRFVGNEGFVHIKLYLSQNYKEFYQTVLKLRIIDGYSHKRDGCNVQNIQLQMFYGKSLQNILSASFPIISEPNQK